MDVTKLAHEYVTGDAHLKKLQERQGKLKELLTKAIDIEGKVSDKGHIYLAAGDLILQRQKRQGKRYLDAQAAEDWAKALGIWDDVKIVKEVLDEDALAGWVWQNRKSKSTPNGETVEDEYEALWVTPEPTFAFMPPAPGGQYDDY